MNQQQRKKSAERSYLEKFLQMNNWEYEIQEGHEEKPDFLLATPEDLVGLEIRNLYKDEEHGGSPKREIENLRSRGLSKLVDAYYAAGGKPVMVHMLLFCPLEDSWIPMLVRRLRMARPTEPWAQKERPIELGENRVCAKFFVRALPDALGEYRLWQCVNNPVGCVRFATDDLLSAAIREKAAKLPLYRDSVQETILLIVAERLLESGKFDYEPGTRLLPNEGFREVHLFIHPEKSYRVA